MKDRLRIDDLLTDQLVKGKKPTPSAGTKGEKE
jgi:hypothetical protein